MLWVGKRVGMDRSRRIHYRQRLCLDGLTVYTDLKRALFLYRVSQTHFSIQFRRLPSPVQTLGLAARLANGLWAGLVLSLPARMAIGCMLSCLLWPGLAWSIL